MAVKAVAHVVNFNSSGSSLQHSIEVKIASGEETATVTLGPFAANAGPGALKAAIIAYTQSEWAIEWDLLDTVNLLGEGLL